MHCAGNPPYSFCVLHPSTICLILYRARVPPLTLFFLLSFRAPDVSTGHFPCKSNRLCPFSCLIWAVSESLVVSRPPCASGGGTGQKRLDQKRSACQKGPAGSGRPMTIGTRKNSRSLERFWQGINQGSIPFSCLKLFSRHQSNNMCLPAAS